MREKYTKFEIVQFAIIFAGLLSLLEILIATLLSELVIVYRDIYGGNFEINYIFTKYFPELIFAMFLNYAMIFPVRIIFGNTPFVALFLYWLFQNKLKTDKNLSDVLGWLCFGNLIGYIGFIYIVIYGVDYITFFDSNTSPEQYGSFSEAIWDIIWINGTSHGDLIFEFIIYSTLISPVILTFLESKIKDNNE